MEGPRHVRPGRPWHIGTVPNTAAAFPRCTSRESLCRRNSPARRSLDSFTSFLPRSWRKDREDSPITPRVSKAIGCTINLGSSSRYLFVFLCSARLATAPAARDACLLYDGASVSETVVSHTSSFPEVHGISVISSGRRAELAERPVGSFRQATWADCRALHITSFKALCGAKAYKVSVCLHCSCS